MPDNLVNRVFEADFTRNDKDFTKNGWSVKAKIVDSEFRDNSDEGYKDFFISSGLLCFASIPKDYFGQMESNGLIMGVMPYKPPSVERHGYFNCSSSQPYYLGKISKFGLASFIVKGKNSAGIQFPKSFVLDNSTEKCYIGTEFLGIFDQCEFSTKGFRGLYHTREIL